MYFKHKPKTFQMKLKRKLTLDVVNALTENLTSDELKNDMKFMAFMDYKGEVKNGNKKEWVIEITSIQGTVFRKFVYKKKKDYFKDVKIMQRLFTTLPKSKKINH